MNEQIRSPHAAAGGPGGLGSIFEQNDPAAQLVTVSSGPYAEQLPVAGMSVGELRTRFRDRFDLDPHSQAVLDGHDVGDDTRLRAGQVLMFTHRAGEKGSRFFARGLTARRCRRNQVLFRPGRGGQP